MLGLVESFRSGLINVVETCWRIYHDFVATMGDMCGEASLIVTARRRCGGGWVSCLSL
jgi:hypothetical protein